MKAILLHIHPDDGADARIDAAIALAQAFGGHITCLQVTPLPTYIGIDPMAGMYAYAPILDGLREAGERERSRAEARLRDAGIDWTWRDVDGAVAASIVRHAALADVVVMSLREPPPVGAARPLPIAAEIAVAAHTAVLAVPVGAPAIEVGGAALIAWKASAEAGRAVRSALPLLRRAASARLLSVGHPRAGDRVDAARDYLALHGVAATVDRIDLNGLSVAETLMEQIFAMRPAYVVMGAYGHARLLEMVLGGVTRALTTQSPVPLLMAH